MAAAASSGSFVFENPTIYDSFDEETDGVIHLPIGAKVFRAERTGAKEPASNIPAFFGNKQTIAPYAKPLPGSSVKSESETYSAFMITKSPRLFHMTLNSLNMLGAMLSEKLEGANTKKENEFLMDALEKLTQYYAIEAGVVIPSLPTGPPPTTTDEFQKYLNRDMAEIICKLGYDGWIVKPFNPEKRHGLEQVSFVRLKGISDMTKLPMGLLLQLFYMERRGLEDMSKQTKIPGKVLQDVHDLITSKSIVPYPPEIMLCNWKEFMNPVSLTGGRHRKTRKNRTRRRK